MGGIIKWAINAALSIVTCSIEGVPCFGSTEMALRQVINCPIIAVQVNQMVQKLAPFSVPSLTSIIKTGCELAKTAAILKLDEELNALTVKLSLMKLSGTANIPNAGQDHSMTDGKWHGVLGSGVVKGNFDGSFSAYRGP